MKDELIVCKRCGGDACHRIPVTQDIETFLCYGCGFQSNTLMKQHEAFYEEQINNMPELYKDLMFQDDESKFWFPYSRTIEDQGMVFVHGTSTADWKWAAVKAVKRTEQDKKLHPKIASEYKMDMNNIKFFAEKDFMEALAWIGLLPN